MYYCINEIILGVEIKDILNVGNVVLVVDMLFNIFLSKIDISKFGVIYVGV